MAMSREEMWMVYHKGQMALSTEDMPSGTRRLSFEKWRGELFQDVFRDYPLYINWVLEHMPLANQKAGSNQEEFLIFDVACHSHLLWSDDV